MKLSVETVAKACDALTKSGIVDKNGEYDKEFKGYISAFGVAVVQMGLYPALLIYEDKSANTGAKRYLLADALGIFLDKTDKLSEHYKSLNEETRKLMQKRVNEALVALKLALRIYKPKDEKIKRK